LNAKIDGEKSDGNNNQHAERAEAVPKLFFMNRVSAVSFGCKHCLD
jgi:hypothetical protein